MPRRRSTSELIRDRRRIADMYLQGQTQTHIAETLGLAQSTISGDISALHREWRKSALIDIDERKAQELAKVDRLEREYWAAWEQSCAVGVQVSREKRVGQDAVTQSKTVDKPGGDPRFLAGVERCIERRCKLLGLDAPTKIDHGGTIETKDVTDLPDADRIERLAALFDAARARRDGGADQEPATDV